MAATGLRPRPANGSFPPPRPRRRRWLFAGAALCLFVIGGVLGVATGLGQSNPPAIQQGVISTIGGGEPGGGQGCLTSGVCGTFVQETGTVLRTGETISYVLFTQTGPFGTEKTIVVMPSP